MRENGFYALMGRMKHISRWGLMRSSLPENVQEHSLMTAMLAHALALIRREIFGGEADPDRCAAAALFHDAPEILTGDLPTPVKYFNPAIEIAYRQVEDASIERMLEMLPAALRPSYEALFRPEEPEVRAIVKAADKLSAYIKCLEELRAGNGEFAIAARELRSTLERDPLPETVYFMEHFLDAFRLTLDELR